MENLELIQNLSHFSKYIGSRISDVQGGGGNTSVKYDKYMSIKASGYALKDLSSNSGFSVMDLTSLKVFLSDKKLSQNKFDKLLGSFITSKKYNKPSMEAALHAIIDRTYVAHTHSIFVNIFTCSVEGKQILRELFPSALWVSYATPGLDLYKRFSDSIDNISDIPKIIFLENHGLIICSDDHEEIIDLNEETNNMLISKFRLKEPMIGEDLSRSNLNNLLFPDQAIFLEKIKFTDDDDLSITARETISVVNYLLNSMRDLKLTPKYLDQSEHQKLINLESEKYRKKLEK